VVELRLFGGLTLAEDAECGGVSLSTTDRAWRYARAWLHAAMPAGDSKKASRDCHTGEPRRNKGQAPIT
jgi:hypothetical protein